MSVPPRRATVAGMDRTSVMTWVDGYERAWREGDAAAVDRLFTEDVRYRRSPYSESMVGHAAVRDFWLEDEGLSFTMTAEPVAVEGSTAVVRVRVHYGAPDPREYQDLWVLRFAADGRVEDFEEWAYWPDKPYTAG
jgi:ketosteroid isomerase-like protein